MGRLAVALSLGAFAAVGSPKESGAQAASTLPLTDPAYQDLEILEAFGLAPRESLAQRPISRSRLARVLSWSRRSLAGAAAELPSEVRLDLEGLLARLERRFVGPDDGPWSGELEAEAGGGRSPGQAVPDVGLGRVDAVTNPLWSGSGGRGYGDRLTLAVAGSGDRGVGTRFALGLGGRASLARATDTLPGRDGAVLERLYGRLVLGRLAFQVGRDWVAWGHGHGGGLLLSENGPPLDMIRMSSEQPWALPVLGSMDLTLMAADLGAGQNYPHAKLFGARADFSPSRTVSLGFSMLNKQMGEGAPEASVGARIRDLTAVWGLFRGDDLDRFSEKLVGADVRAVFPGAPGLDVSASAVLTDFDRDRVGNVLEFASAGRISVGLKRLGRSQRHQLALDLRRIGPLVYRHHQFRTGLAVDGHLQGSPLGPGGLGGAVEYAYAEPAAGRLWQAHLSAERRSADPLDRRPGPTPEVFRSDDLPDERRVRFELRSVWPLWGGEGLVEVMVGVERVSDFGFRGGSRSNGAARAHVRRVF